MFLESFFAIICSVLSFITTNSICVGIIANTLYTILVALLIWCTVRKKQYEFNQFFGVDKNNEIHVFISTFKIPQGTIKDTFDFPNNEELFSIAVGEFDLIPEIYHEISKKKFFDSETFAGIVDSILTLSKPKITFRYSDGPTVKLNDLPKLATICIGSSLYNQISKKYLEDLHSEVIFDMSQGKISIICNSDSGTGDKSQSIFAGTQDQDYAMLAKLHKVDEDGVKQIIFIAAGTGVNGTKAAVYHLLKNWNTERKNHKDGNFAIILEESPNSKNGKRYENFLEKRRIY
jgi:hypothetical protein